MISSPLAGLRSPRGLSTAARRAAQELPAAGPRALRVTGALLGLAAIGIYLVMALARLTYPFTVEVLESNSLIEVHRILAGQPLYAPPGVSYVPDGYPPLYFWVSAAVGSVLGQSYLSLRLVSLTASLACFALLARLVQRETASACAGMAAAGVLAATYFAVGKWFDVARVDSLFLAFSIAALYTARWMRRARGAIAAGLLLAAAFLTKQTALAEGVAVLVAVAAGPRRRLAVPAALTYAAVVVGSTLVLGFTSHGWYVYYIFEQMSENRFILGAIAGFGVGYLLPTLGLACCAAVLCARRMPLVLVAGYAALVLEGFAALVHAGGNVNDLLPAYLVVALLAGPALGGQPLPWLAVGLDRLAAARGVNWLSGHAGRWAAAAAGLLVIAQLAVLMAALSPAQAIPPVEDRAVGQRLVMAVRELGGTVAIPADPGLALTAGLPAVEDQIAAADVLHGKDRAAIVAFTDSVAAAVATRRFSAIITELPKDLRGFPPDLPRYYQLCPQMPLAGVPPAPFSPGPGGEGHSVSVWVPVGGESCAAAVRALEGLSPAARPGVLAH